MGTVKYAGLTFIDAEIDEVNLPCSNCTADCCSSTTEFPIEEVTKIKKKYKSLFKKVTIKDSSIPGHVLLKLKGVPHDERCVFLDDNNKCKIYDDRFTICKFYGKYKFAVCPFNNMDGIPSDYNQIVKYRRKAIESQTEYIAKAFLSSTVSS